MTSVCYYPLPAQSLSRCGAQGPETCRDRAQSHPDYGDSRSSRSKRKASKNILTLKMTTVESVTSSDALKKSADTVAKAAFNKSDKGDFSQSTMIRSKAIFSEP